MKTLAFLTTALACCALVPTGAVQGINSQAPVQGADSRPAFRARTEMVALNVTVVDSHERHVTGLTSGDFAVYDDGVPQKVNFFASDEVPIDLAVLIDTSSSMIQRLPLVRKAATRFVQALRPIDRGAVVAFADQMRFLQPFTHDVGLLERAIASTSAHGETALFSTLYVVLKEFAKAGRNATEVRRPAIVVLTDGEDTVSLVGQDDVIELVRRTGVAIYTISIAVAVETRNLDAEGKNRTFNLIDDDLRRLARESGGQAFFPLRLDELNSVYSWVARELSAQYSLAYMPNAPARTGVFHKLMVQVVSRGDAFPRTRLGYIAAQ
jgi:Ca-activated chloride channel family protein